MTNVPPAAIAPSLPVPDDHYGPRPDWDRLATLALRRNPKRRHLVVSRVLAKHLPTPGSTALEAGEALARAIRTRDVGPGQRGTFGGTVVLAMAETATALGRIVAEALPSTAVVHTTRDRRDEPGVWFAFRESHSHAPAHIVLAGARQFVAESGTVVLVDDELTTGHTAWALISELDQRIPGREYVVSCLIDGRSGQWADRLEERADAVGLQLSVVSLWSGQPPALPTEWEAFGAPPRYEGTCGVPNVTGLTNPPVMSAMSPPLVLSDLRRGATAADVSRDANALDAVARQLAPLVEGRLLVVGVEEEMYAAVAIAARLNGETVSSTRSPILVVDHPGYPIHSGVQLRSAYDPDVPSFLYNVPGPGRGYGTALYDTVVLVLPTGTSPDTCPSGLVQAVSRFGRRPVITVDVVRRTGTR